MYTIQSTFSFEAAHRLYDVDTYSEECRKNLHGHSYKLTVFVGREELNSSGMVVDFKRFKQIVNSAVVERYDHSCILRDCDPILPVIQANCDKVFSYEENPTAEWMAKRFHDLISYALKIWDDKLIVKKVCVQETENNIAIYEED